MNRKESGISFGRILKILLIIMGVLIICTAVFFWFYIHKNAKLALRDAKNVYMALNSVEIEYYAQGKSIYDPKKYNGLADGVLKKVQDLVENEGTFRILSYDEKSHQILVLQYRLGYYQINYDDSPTETVWEVNYMFNVYRFED